MHASQRGSRRCQSECTASVWRVFKACSDHRAMSSFQVQLPRGGHTPRSSAELRVESRETFDLASIVNNHTDFARAGELVSRDRAALVPWTWPGPLWKEVVAVHWNAVHEDVARPTIHGASRRRACSTATQAGPASQIACRTASENLHKLQMPHTRVWQVAAMPACLLPSVRHFNGHLSGLRVSDRRH
jgi:hypothetical protein